MLSGNAYNGKDLDFPSTKQLESAILSYVKSEYDTAVVSMRLDRKLLKWQWYVGLSILLLEVTSTTHCLTQIYNCNTCYVFTFCLVFLCFNLVTQNKEVHSINNLGLYALIFCYFISKLWPSVVQQFGVFLLYKTAVFDCRLQLLLQCCIFILKPATDVSM